MNPGTERFVPAITAHAQLDTEFYPVNQSVGRELIRHTTQENTMDKEHLKGAIDKTKGAVKDAVGGLSGDTGLQVEGKVDKAKGTVRQKVGDAKDAARDAIDKG